MKSANLRPQEVDSEPKHQYWVSLLGAV